MDNTRRSLAGTLAAAATAMARADPRSMAEHLRAAWRDSKDPNLAGIYELLLGAARIEALAGRDPAERADAWRKRATRGRGDPLELPVLLAEPWHPDLSELERLQLLAGWTPDPLLAAAMADRLRLPLVPPERLGGAQIVADTVRLLAAQRDPRQLEGLELLARDPGLSAELRRQLRGAIASLRVVSVVPIDPRARAAMAPLEQRAREQRRHRANSAALLEAVYAAPDADEPRLVYADWLTTQGDPHGEFITLQLERSGRPTTDPGQEGSGSGRDRIPKPAPSTREIELLRRHQDQWSGVLHGVLGAQGRVFERGFLAAGSIEVGKLDGEIITAAQWSTLRSLDGHVPELLAVRGRLDHLRTLYGFLALERFVALRAAGRLESVEHYECSLADPNLRFDTPLGLRSLLVRRALDEQLRALFGSAACAGLELLGLYYEPEQIGGSPRRWTGDHRERPSLRARYQLLSAELPPHVLHLRMLDAETSRASRPLGCELSFERDERGEFSDLRIDVHAKPSEAHLSARARARGLVALIEPLIGQLTQVTLGTIDPEHDRDLLRAELATLTEAHDVELGY